MVETRQCVWSRFSHQIVSGAKGKWISSPLTFACLFCAGHSAPVSPPQSFVQTTAPEHEGCVRHRHAKLAKGKFFPMTAGFRKKIPTRVTQTHVNTTSIDELSLARLPNQIVKKRQERRLTRKSAQWTRFFSKQPHDHRPVLSCHFHVLHKQSQFSNDACNFLPVVEGHDCLDIE